MKNQSIQKVWLLGVAAFLIAIPSDLSWAGQVKPFDHSTWDRFLKQFVNERGEVNYQAVKADPSLLNQYLEALADVPLKTMAETWPREEKLAMWLNAYHAGVVRAIVDHYPVRSINDIPGVWEMAAVRIGGASYSLNTVRSEKLMRAFRDEKIQVSLYCGAVSCPRLQREAFTGPRVEGQLFLSTVEFVNNADYVEVIPGQKKIQLSRIFKWYAGDFKLDFGAPITELKITTEQQSVLSFLAFYLRDAAKVEYLEGDQYKVKYMPFNWALNEASPAPVQA